MEDFQKESTLCRGPFSGSISVLFRLCIYLSLVCHSSNSFFARISDFALYTCERPHSILPSRKIMQHMVVCAFTCLDPVTMGSQHKHLATTSHQWNFQGPPMTPFPYYSHTTPIRMPKDMGMVWEWYGKLTIRGSHYWGSLKSPLITPPCLRTSTRTTSWQHLTSAMAGLKN